MVREISVPLVARQEGFLGCYVGAPIGSNSDKYAMVSLWENVDALRKSAGEDWEQSVIPEPEREILEETFVHRYDCYDEAHPMA